MIGLPKLGASASRTFRGMTDWSTFAAEVLARIGRHLAREIQSRVVHRQHHAVDSEGRIHALLHEMHGVQELRESLERVVLALERNQ